jgi:hypothetical protein
MTHMKRGSLAAFLLGLLLASFPHQLLAETNEIQLRWDELSGLAVGKEIDLRLNDGTRVTGELLAVRPDALSIDVSKTSDKRTYPKGQREIPRASVSTFEIRRLKTARWRVVGTSAGVVAGIFAGAGVSVGLCQHACGAGAVWSGIGTGVGVAILGNRLGHEGDMQRTIVKIIP